MGTVLRPAKSAGRLLTVAVAVLATDPTRADTVVIGGSADVRDNTLYEDPDGALSNGPGHYFFLGRPRVVETFGVPCVFEARLRRWDVSPRLASVNRGSDRQPTQVDIGLARQP